MNQICPSQHLRDRATIISLAGPRSHVRRLTREPKRTLFIDERVWFFGAGMALMSFVALWAQGNL